VSTPTQQTCIETLPGYYPLYRLVQRYPERYPFLLESTARSQTVQPNARYDILFAFPQAILKKDYRGKLTYKDQSIADATFLSALDRVWQDEHRPQQSELPFSGGWFLFFGYELVQEIEPSLRLPVQPTHLPAAQATRIPVAALYDHAADKTILLAEAEHAASLQLLKSDILACTTPQAASKQSHPAMVQEDPPEHYPHAVNKILDYIRAGDVFQVNLSRLWQQHLANAEPVMDVYTRLRDTNPAPFAGMALFPGGGIYSSSPERLLRVIDGVIETRPIAGTRPRHAQQQTDMQLQQELLAHPKERAEHIMLIDLERNDLGRICIPGTVKVNELMVLETYAHVHHIVSNVQGRLKPEITPGQIIRAVFPGGTITGCPKVRCMEIIAELEQAPRGPYTGSLGYLNHDGNMDLNILIRTIVQDGDRLNIRAGGGIVADSEPLRELAETRAKAKGMLMALQGS
jgi:anthranilate synthase component 1